MTLLALVWISMTARGMISHIRSKAQLHLKPAQWFQGRRHIVVHH